MSKKTIPTIPQPELKSQPINMMHKAEFVVNYTQLIFLPKLVAAMPNVPDNPHQYAQEQLDLMIAAFPTLHNVDLAAVYGYEHQADSIVRWPDYERRTGMNVTHYNLENQLFGSVTPRGVGALCNGMSRTLREAMFATKDGTSYDDLRTQFRKDNGTVHTPQRYCHLHDLITDKKVQDPKTGVVSRTPVIKSQLVNVIPKGVQKKVLKWNKNNTFTTAKVELEIKKMYDFSQELYQGLVPVRNTKQLQERWPEIFDDFCAVTGLGQCHGTSLMPHHEVGNVNSVINEFHSK